jgi:hypothetical protein
LISFALARLASLQSAFALGQTGTFVMRKGLAGKPSTIDPDGRYVILHEDTIEHLRSRRPELLDHIDAILQGISRPDLRERDPFPGRERFYLQHIFVRRWLRIVVDFNESPAFVVTAFVQDNAPGAKP